MAIDLLLFTCPECGSVNTNAEVTGVNITASESFDCWNCHQGFKFVPKRAGNVKVTSKDNQESGAAIVLYAISFSLFLVLAIEFIRTTLL